MLVATALVEFEYHFRGAWQSASLEDTALGLARNASVPHTGIRLVGRF